MTLLSCLEYAVDVFFSLLPRRKPCIKQASKTLLIAHRGAHQHAKGIIENTHQAFLLAQMVGCWGIELDVHTTSDGVLVVHHDPTLVRLWGDDRAIAQLSFKELRAAVPQIPSLAEVVTQYGQAMHLFIELKVPVDESNLLMVLEGRRPVHDYHVLTLDEAIFVNLTKLPRESLLLVALHSNVKRFCELSIKEKYGGVLGNYLLLSDRYRKQLDKAKQQSGVGFVDSKNSLYRELHRNISWIFTNQAEYVSHCLDALR